MNGSSKIVLVEEIEDTIVKITMQDKDTKNGFSKKFISSLEEAFAYVADSQRYRVVILTGYDSYFCSGGTKEALLELFDGKSKFTNAPIYSLPLDCRIPVISAMQGHAIGGGFVFGLFADFVILSRESVYTTNFMKYGFTPGFGSTLILKEKLGLSLAQELLIGAGNFRGVELLERGIPYSVLPREAVLKRAQELARSIAEMPRLSLITLKDHLMNDYRERLPRIVEAEVAMHETTIHQPEVKNRIHTLFGN